MQPRVISVTVTLGGYFCTGPGPRSPLSPVAPDKPVCQGEEVKRRRHMSKQEEMVRGRGQEGADTSPSGRK